MADLPKLSQRRIAFHSLTFKVGALAILVLGVVLAMFSAVFIISERQKTSEDILKNGQTFANFSAPRIYDSYVQLYTHPQASDFQAFKSSVSSVLSYNKDVRGVSLLAQNGRLLFDSSEFTSGKYQGPARTIDDEATLAAVHNESLSARNVTVNGEHLTEIVVPLTETSGGHVVSMRYLLSYATLSARMQDIYKRIAVVTLLLQLFVVVVVILCTTRLTRPLTRLTRVAEELRSGNFDARASYDGKDELGGLARTLNDMADKVKGYYENLESKVRERTSALEAIQVRLRANVQRDEALIASIGDGVIATDKEGTVLLMNKAAEEMLKLPRDQAIGRRYDDLWTIETEDHSPLPMAERPLTRAITLGKPLKDSSHYCVRKDRNGKDIVRFPLSLSISPVMLNDQTFGTINVFSDITHEKQVDRMKTEFISLASHQLRTPLSAIRWFNEMLLSGDAGKLTDEQQELAQNAYDSTARMIELVNSLLNTSRIESGRIIVDPQPTDLKELIQSVVNDLKGKTEAKKQTLIVDVHADLPKINLDVRLISQVYLNFLTNAIKYSPQGAEISVFVSRKGEELVSQISDNGYGIPKAQQARVFQKFFRAENAVKVETDGTGLGLYLVKAIIESSGGRVWFESEENKGTSFWFSLPMSGMKSKAGEVTLDA
ncbi:MAG TPA: ATP-binding protein [Patescibacteria group bacterium]|nr:ATP-binding protein [Patescibacteria group bacterium]